MLNIGAAVNTYKLISNYSETFSNVAICPDDFHFMKKITFQVLSSDIWFTTLTYSRTMFPVYIPWKPEKSWSSGVSGDLK